MQMHKPETVSGVSTVRLGENILILAGTLEKWHASF
jgi:hypothetical protein